MKKILLCMVMLVMLFSVAVFAEEEPKQVLPKQVLSVNPLGLAFGIFNVEYESVISDSSTWAVKGLYWNYETGDWSWSALGAGGRYRGYFSPKAPAGGYWGAGEWMC